ncbi:hypothetical protein Tco_0760854 [Tanacetum coccineum]
MLKASIVELCMEIIPDEEEVTIDAIPLAVKSPRIVDWKIHKEGKKSYYQIIRADGKSQMYMVFSHMLKSFDREDLEDLYKLVKARYGSTRPVESMDYLLWNDMKIMFEPHVEDAVWRNQQGYKVLEWKLYDSCGVHSLMMQSMQIYMLVEKKYPLTPPTLSMMLEKKLQIDYESKMAYQLCKLIIKQLKNLLDAVRITAAQVYVNTALMKIMSSITAQQAKLDLELVPKEKRLEIGKCNERLNPGKIQREPTFQVVLDALALTSCYCRCSRSLHASILGFSLQA